MLINGLKKVSGETRYIQEVNRYKVKLLVKAYYNILTNHLFSVCCLPNDNKDYCKHLKGFIYIGAYETKVTQKELGKVVEKKVKKWLKKEKVLKK